MYHVLTNQNLILEYITNEHNLVTSDHLMLCSYVKFPRLSKTNICREVLKWKRANFQETEHSLDRNEFLKDFQTHLTINERINVVWHKWKTCLLDLVDLHVPKIRLKNGSCAAQTGQAGTGTGEGMEGVREMGGKGQGQVDLVGGNNR